MKFYVFWRILTRVLFFMKFYVFCSVFNVCCSALHEVLRSFIFREFPTLFLSREIACIYLFGHDEKTQTTDCRAHFCVLRGGAAINSTYNKTTPTEKKNCWYSDNEWEFIVLFGDFDKAPGSHELERTSSHNNREKQQHLHTQSNNKALAHNAVGLASSFTPKSDFGNQSFDKKKPFIVCTAVRYSEKKICWYSNLFHPIS